MPLRGLRKIETIGWILLALFGGVSLIFLPLVWPVAIGLGGTLALLNFRCIDIYFGRVFNRQAPKPSGWFYVMHGTRFIALLGALAAAVAWGRLPVVGIAVGLTVLVMAILLYGVIAMTGRKA